MNIPFCLRSVHAKSYSIAKNWFENSFAAELRHVTNFVAILYDSVRQFTKGRKIRGSAFAEHSIVDRSGFDLSISSNRVRIKGHIFVFLALSAFEKQLEAPQLCHPLRITGCESSISRDQSLCHQIQIGPFSIFKVILFVTSDCLMTPFLSAYAVHFTVFVYFHCPSRDPLTRFFVWKSFHRKSLGMVIFQLSVVSIALTVLI